MYPRPVEARIYKALILIVLISATTFLSLRLFKLSRAGVEIDLSLEVTRVAVNFGMLILLAPISVESMKLALQKKRASVPIMLSALLVYLFAYAAVSNLTNYFIGNSPDFDILKNLRKLAINFGHIAILAFSSIAAVSYWSLRPLTHTHLLLKDLQGANNRVPVGDIVLVKSDDHYQKVYTKDKLFYIRDTISGFQKRLNEGHFQRVHRSCLVNLREISQFMPHSNGEYFLEMTNGEKVKVSRSYKEEIKRYLRGVK